MQTRSRQEGIEAYAQGYERLQQTLGRFPRAMWHYRTAEGEWTIHEIVLHLPDSEANGYVRLRKALAEPGGAIMPYDEAGWAAALHYEEQEIEDALELFRLLRRTNTRLLQSLSDDEWSHTYEHPERGPLTLDDWLDIYIGHVELHSHQMEQIFEAWQQRG